MRIILLEIRILVGQMVLNAMNKLPLIVGFGGYNAAGRSSFHHGFRRTVLNSLNKDKRVNTLLSLAVLMKLVRFENGGYIDADDTVLTAAQVADKYQSTIESNSLIRKIHTDHFDVERVPTVRDIEFDRNEVTQFTLRRKDLPQKVPSNWNITTLDDKTVIVSMNSDFSFKMMSFKRMDVQSAGTLPTGFNPANEYNSRFHPKGLQMTVLGASDALNSVGIPWHTIMQSVKPDEVAVYAASALGQSDEYGIGGYMQARLKGTRPTSKHIALGFNTMPADFINAYLLGSVGTTGAITGACATFLYNLRLAVDDIKSGRHRVVICGTAEAPVLPEIMEGFAAMSALASDEKLAKLDQQENCNHQRASRPFGDNVGFTIGESAQFFVLMDDALAMELGADIYGAVPDVFVNADGFKKSISSPGSGNYVTMSKAVAAASAIVGEEAIKDRSFIQAHGSSTPQNRLTESMIFDKVAQTFNIEHWPVTAVKAFLGHSIGAASGDQLANALGVFADGIVPGIKTVDKIAADVVDERLDILLEDQYRQMDVAFLNSKGFGGNNATASVLSPLLVESMLQNRYGDQSFEDYKQRRKAVRSAAVEYDEAANRGDLRVIYHFGESVIEDHQIHISESEMTIDDFEQSINLEFTNPYLDMQS